MQKLSGGPQLACGHMQQVSNYRLALATSGVEQRLVWCIECAGWSRLVPVSVNLTDGNEDA